MHKKKRQVLQACHWKTNDKCSTMLHRDFYTWLACLGWHFTESRWQSCCIEICSGSDGTEKNCTGKRTRGNLLLFHMPHTNEGRSEQRNQLLSSHTTVRLSSWNHLHTKIVSTNHSGELGKLLLEFKLACETNWVARTRFQSTHWRIKLRTIAQIDNGQWIEDFRN